MRLDKHLCGDGVAYLPDDTARRIFGESAAWIMRRGELVGCSGPWELWSCYGRLYHVHPASGQVKPAVLAS